MAGSISADRVPDMSKRETMNLLLLGAISKELGLGFTVADFGAAFLGAIVVSLVGLGLSLVIGTGRKVL
jgi:uncharacterized membrane protein YvlD (DUF360 family)